MKIFVDTDSDIRLVRRLRRDITERGRDIEGVIKQYNKFVKPAFEQYIEPTMRLADIVVPRGGREPGRPHTAFCFLIAAAKWLCVVCSLQGGGNMVAIDLIVQHVHSQLEEVSGHRGWRHHVVKRCNTEREEGHKLYFYISCSKACWCFQSVLLKTSLSKWLNSFLSNQDPRLIPCWPEILSDLCLFHTVQTWTTDVLLWWTGVKPSPHVIHHRSVTLINSYLTCFSSICS